MWIFKPHQYQHSAIQFMFEQPMSGLFADPGLGKTAITLQLLNFVGGKTLIVAPLRVVYSVWPAEIKKWEQFAHMSVAILHGKDKDKALRSDADIYLINPEGLPWLTRQDWPEFENLIVDESSGFKNSRTKRFKILKTILSRFRRRHILTGTPAPNGLLDLFGQIFILDGGRTLGKYITHYRTKYFYPHGYKNYLWALKPGADLKIYDAIAPLTMRIDSATHLDLPDLIVNDIQVELPPAARKIYKGLENDLFAEIEGQDVLIPTAAAAYNVCCQVANGAMYGPKNPFDTENKRDILPIHDEKVNCCRALVGELQGKCALIVYRYKHDLAALLKEFPGAPNIGGGVSASDSQIIIDRWNRRETPVLLLQGQSAAHGLNLQDGGNDLIWFGLTDHYEIYEQMNRRIYRQGVKGQVRIHRLIATGTVDEVICARLDRKKETQQDLFTALEEYRRRQNG